MKLKMLLLNLGKNWLGPSRLPKVFTKAGFEITLITQPESIASKTKYADNIIFVSDNIEDFLTALDRCIERNTYDLIIPADEPTIKALIDNNYKYADMCLPFSKDKFLKVYGKSDFAKFADCNDLPAPKSFAINGILDMQNIPNLLTYPFIIKPVEGCAGKGIEICRNEKEFGKVLQLYCGEKYVAQEFLSGKIGIAICYYKSGTLICWTSYYKSKTYAGDYGPSSINTSVFIPDFEEILVKIGKLTGINGFIGVDFIESVDGIKIIEINWRPVPQIHIGKYIGVDYSRIIKDTFKKIHGNNIVYQSNVRKSFYLFPQDIYRCIEQTDKAGIIKWFLYPSRWKDIMWDDHRVLLWHYKEILAKSKGYLSYYINAVKNFC